MSAMAACTTATDPTPIATIQLEPGIDSIEPGQSFGDWVVTLRDANGNMLAGRSLSWESQNLSVATIDAATGVVTAVASGTTTITVRAEGKSAQSTMKVIPPVVSIIATPDSFDLPMTTTRTIAVQLVGPNGTALSNRQLAWSSANASVAAVSTSGLVTPVAVGLTTVTVIAGGKSAEIRVRVVAEPAASVRILPAGVQVIRLGQLKQLTAECLNATQQVLTGRTIEWNSSNPLVASVGTTGLVSGVSLGQANISATCDGTVTTNATAQVTPVPVSTVTISPPQINLQVGQQGQLTATARDSANNVLSLQGRTVTWTSDNLPVATVSNAGVVAAASAGVAHIQVSIDGILSQVVDATVTNVPVASVTIGPLNPAVVCGQQIQLTAVMRDANGNTLNGRAVTWLSQTQGVATIGAATGVATGVAAGTSQITATSEGVPGFIVLTVNPPQVGACP